MSQQYKKTDYYGQCPVCGDFQDTDCFGSDDEEMTSDYPVSHFECKHCQITFSVYDKHDDYRYFREDHANWYYVIDYDEA